MEEENYLKNIKKGQKVEILTKSKKLVTGYVEELASRTEFHRHGIMVMLTNRQVGRVQRILSDLPESKLIPIIKKGETYNIEFKKDILWSINYTEIQIKESKSYELHTFRHKASKIIIAKSICALLNSQGGNLLIGIQENRSQNKEDEIIGIEPDLERLKLQGKAEGLDAYKRMIIDDIIRPYFPPKIYNHLIDFIKFEFEEIDKKIILNISVSRSASPIFLNLEGKKMFMIRTDTQSRQIENEELVDYCMKRFRS
ncbi:hypothetical protein COU57_02570 [Candidatus Pacearchaeota archaeon CG10_big_fil_rev_8_21_14_0_10_32_14]|nr:MAG: hypothetical protein COU57_02570 [Candidatus Pacearchaeota archaeon CG10_big_fil_rev_8_21_14_0_10_32_14]